MRPPVFKWQDQSPKCAANDQDKADIGQDDADVPLIPPPNGLADYVADTAL